MKLEIKDNKNYCAYVVEIDNFVPLDGCDNIQGTVIFSNHVIISKDTQLGTRGVYFPVETSLSSDFLRMNNLYRDKSLNNNNEKSGFFELNGRIRAMKLRGYKSDGFFIPLLCFNYLHVDIKKLSVGDIFDSIDGNIICKKYIVRNFDSQGSGKKGRGQNKLKRFSKLIENQFRFHIDTDHLDRNIHKIHPSQTISITNKIHGSSDEKQKSGSIPHYCSIRQYQNQSRWI